MLIIEKIEAQILGKKRYFTGKLCRKDHLSERFTSSGACCECLREAARSERGKAWRRRYEKTEAFKKKMSTPEKLAKKQEYDRKRGRTEERKKYSRDLRFRKKYGFSRGEFETLLVLQNNSCLICARSFENLGDTKKRKGAPVIDHCHSTGKVRGLLCGTCNSGIGMFDENPDFLRKAIAYLDASRPS